MTTARELHIGQRVVVTWLDREGTVEEIDGSAARVVCYSDERECWAQLDDLVPVEPAWTRIKVTQ